MFDGFWILGDDEYGFAGTSTRNHHVNHRAFHVDHQPRVERDGPVEVGDAEGQEYHGGVNSDDELADGNVFQVLAYYGTVIS